MKRIICAIFVLIMFLSGTATAASYTLPEKMQNQLAIGSGLKGTFTVTSEGDISRTPFLNAVSDAVYDLRGMASGHDLHYYLFQENNGSQTILGELYRKEGTYYFRSDMVQDKILGLTGLSVYLDGLFEGKSENPTLSSALMNYLTLSEDIREKQWKPVLNKYENSLEMWLHDFTAQAEVVKQENGSSAFDFSYVIPIDEVKNKIVSLFAEFAEDTELQALLDTVMTDEQKELYLNGALTYFYAEAVNALDLKDEVRLSKRVSALGDLIDSKLVLPLDPKVTGFEKITIQSNNECSVYQLEGEDKLLVLGMPLVDLLKDQEYEVSVWLAEIDRGITEKEKNASFSVKADIKKTFSQYNDEEEKSHQSEHYSVIIRQDKTMLPESFKNAELAEWNDIDAELDLHWHSKYSQNSATTLEIKAGFNQNGSSVKIEGKVKTAAPWLFMPFEIKEPIEIGPDHHEITEGYIADWISNAASMIHHSEPEENTQESVSVMPEHDSGNESSANTEGDVSDTAEAAPLPEEVESGDDTE